MITNKMKTVQLKMREACFRPAPQWRGKDKKFQFALKIGWRAPLSGASQQRHFPTGGGYRIRTCKSFRSLVFETSAIPFMPTLH